MNISVFSSDKFILGAKIMLSSFLANNNYEKHNIFIISNDLKEKNYNKLKRHVKKHYNQDIYFVSVNKDSYEKFIVDDVFGVAGCHKLYVFNYLPKKIDRIMCLDSDMVVLGSLKEYYYQNLNNNVIAACEDCYAMKDIEHMKELNLDNKSYYNLGNIVIDLNKYLNQYSEEQFSKWLQDNKEIAKYVAQDVINDMLRNSIQKNNGNIYNYMVMPWDKKRAKKEFLPKGLKIIHYVGKIKPWDFRYESYGIEEYTYEVMKKQGMKKELLKIRIMKRLFRLKYSVINIIKK